MIEERRKWFRVFPPFGIEEAPRFKRMRLGRYTSCAQLIGRHDDVSVYVSVSVSCSLSLSLSIFLSFFPSFLYSSISLLSLLQAIKEKERNRKKGNGILMPSHPILSLPCLPFYYTVTSPCPCRTLPLPLHYPLANLPTSTTYLHLFVAKREGVGRGPGAESASPP